MEEKVEIQLGFIHDADATAASVTLRGITPLPMVFTGASKRHPEDTPDDRIGVALAVSRALAKASKALVAQADRDMQVAATRTMMRMVPDGNTTLTNDGVWTWQ